MLDKLRNYLLLGMGEGQTDLVVLSRISALRIFTLCGLSLILAVSLHSSYQGWLLGHYEILLINFIFYAILLVQAGYARRYFKSMSYILLLMTGLGGVAIMLLVREFQLTKLGGILLYSLPLIALLMSGIRASLIAMLFNLVPFVFLLKNKPAPDLFDIDISLPDTHLYLNWLIFLCFNICLPLAVARVLMAFEKTVAQRQSLISNMAHNNAFYRLIFESGEQGRLVINLQGLVETANRRARRLLADPHPEGKPLSTWLPAELLQELQQPCVRQCQIRNQEHWQLSSMNLADGAHQLVLIDDQTENRRLRLSLQAVQEQSQQRRWFDELTGLPNLSSFLHRLRLAFNEQHPPAVLAMIKVQAPLQEQHNYSAHWLAKQITTSLFEQDFLCAWDPDTLLLALAPRVGRSMEELLNELLTEQMSRHAPVQLGCGLLSRPEATEPERLLRHVRYALEQLQGRAGVQLFDAQRYCQEKEDAALLEDLKMALANRELEVAYQPQYCLHQRSITGLEALARWHHPERGNIPPGRFCRLAEENGLSVALTEAVLSRISRDRREWLEAGIEVPSISVNFSTHELGNDALIRHWLTLFHEYGLGRNSIEIELTESAFTEDESALSRRLGLLRKMGYAVAVDDFGTGYSSLGRVVTMPVSKIKVDRSLIRDITSNERKRKLVRTMQVLSQTLDAQLLIEGVEEADQLECLQLLGCHLYQGYYFSRPVSAMQMMALLDKSGEDAFVSDGDVNLAITLG